MSDTELLPCPFCDTDFPPVTARDGNGDLVICTGCSALGPSRRSPEEAITAWNTRPTQGHDALEEMQVHCWHYADALTRITRLVPVKLESGGGQAEFEQAKFIAKSALTNLPTPQAEGDKCEICGGPISPTKCEYTACHAPLEKPLRFVDEATPQAEGELAFVGRLERVTAELDRIAHDNERFGQSPALDRDTAERAIHQIYGLYECKAGTTGSGYAWTALQNILGLYAPRIPVSPQAESSPLDDGLVADLEAAMQKADPFNPDMRTAARAHIDACEAVFALTPRIITALSTIKGEG